MEQENQINESVNAPKEQKFEKPAKKKKGFSLLLFAKLLLLAAIVFAGIQYYPNLLKKSDVSEISAADKSKVEEIITSILPAGSNIKIGEIIMENDLYKIALSSETGQAMAVYLTKNGKSFFPQIVDIEEAKKQKAAAKEQEKKDKELQEKEMVKNDKPIVELFVMSHCPYGTQIEKGFLPVIDAIGSKIDFKVKFCDYAMHGEKEITEELNQYCIQKEEPEKFISYLRCFLKEGNSDDCAKETKLNSAKIESCVKATDKEFKIMENFNNKEDWANGTYPPFDVFKKENTDYGIQGSPNLVVNGKKVEAARDPKSLLAAVCSGFQNQPEECNKELPTVAAAPGFGFDKTGNQTEASCGQ